MKKAAKRALPIILALALALAIAFPAAIAGVTYAKQADTGINLVDERFELVTLIFRLAGHESYRLQVTEYQQELITAFEKHKNHPAVQYAAELLHISSSDVLAYAMHIMEDMSDLIEDTNSLCSPFGDRWTYSTIYTFWPLVLDFYHDTNFAAYFQSKMPFFLAESERFMGYAYIMGIDEDWFVPYAVKFYAPMAYRFIISPSIYLANDSASVAETAHYAVLASLMDDRHFAGGMLVHEYCHSFGTGAGIMWFMENDEHRKMCEEATHYFYHDELTISVEYMVRAYSILYFADHGDDTAVAYLLQYEKEMGFPHIDEVYKRLREYEQRDPV